MKHISVLLVLITFCACLHAGNKTESVATPLTIHAQDAKGAHVRERVNALAALVKAKKLSEAEPKAVQLRAEYEATFDPKLKQFTFQSQPEYEEFRLGSSQPFEWIDWGYKECLQMQAFIKSEQHDFPGALAQLKAQELIAPISAGTLIEFGYVQNQLGKFDDALATYKRARSLAIKYNSQKLFHAPALRGMGFSLVELHKLEEADQVFKQSIGINPGNRVALNELSYIERLRTGNLPNPSFNGTSGGAR